MTLQDRLLRFIDTLEITVQSFEKQCGLSNAAVSKMSDNTRMSTLGKISNTFPQLNISWLRTGEGEMLKAPDESADEPEAEASHARESYKLVPLINIDSVGGVHSPNLIEPSEQYPIKLLPFTDAREGDVAIIQTGNSMSPTIPPGSVLLIRKVEDWQEYFGYGNIYVLWLRDGRRITKEVRRYDPDPKIYVWCVSYNPDVADEELPRNLIRGVWKVIKYQADFGW